MQCFAAVIDRLSDFRAAVAVVHAVLASVIPTVVYAVKEFIKTDVAVNYRFRKFTDDLHNKYKTELKYIMNIKK